MFKLIIFISFSSFCFSQTKILLNEMEKEYIVIKYVKIQSYMDALKNGHRISQNDSVEYDESVNVHFLVIKNIGLDCDSNTIDKTDININKIRVKNIGTYNFEIFSAYYISSYKYFLALDDTGWVFPLSNFWIDDFQRFINKEIGPINSNQKALDAIRILAATKLYNIGGSAIIIDKGNIDSIKVWYPELNAVNKLGIVRCTKANSGDFHIESFIYFPLVQELKYYQFELKENGKLKYSGSTIFKAA